MKYTEVISLFAPYILYWGAGFAFTTYNGNNCFKIYVPSWLRRILFIFKRPERISIIAVIWQIGVFMRLFTPIMLLTNKNILGRFINPYLIFVKHYMNIFLFCCAFILIDGLIAYYRREK